MNKSIKLAIPGAAGLVGQNLVVLLKEAGFTNIVAFDKHPTNTQVLQRLHPDIKVIQADVSMPGDWQEEFSDVDIVVMLQAQIGSKKSDDFVRNNIDSAKQVLEASKRHQVPYIIHISSSVVESVADDDYTNTKKEQEKLVIESGIPYVVLRPTLMFGWFDRKHLGWLSRFMKKSPVFPIPGDGKYMRQPLYVLDFCKIILSCIQQQPKDEIYNITGHEEIDYVDMIKEIRGAVGSNIFIVHIPYWFFWSLLKIYSFFDKEPPFTADQLKALVACDEFEVIPWPEIFHVKFTPFKAAIKETFSDERYSDIVLDF